MTAATLTPETQRRLDAKAERLAARIWRVCTAELNLKVEDLRRDSLAPLGAPSGAPSRLPPDGGRFAQPRVIMDPEAVTAAAHALGIVCGRMIAGASDKTGRAIVQTIIERAALTANAAAAAERADAAREAAALADKLN